MKVYMNKKEIDIFQGATLWDVLLAYSKHSFKMATNGYLAVYDRFGFLTELDGPAMESQHFFLKVAPKNS
jgi:hypothetical protein